MTRLDVDRRDRNVLCLLEHFQFSISPYTAVLPRIPAAYEPLISLCLSSSLKNRSAWDKDRNAWGTSYRREVLVWWRWQRERCFCRNNAIRRHRRPLRRGAEWSSGPPFKLIQVPLHGGGRRTESNSDTGGNLSTRFSNVTLPVATSRCLRRTTAGAASATLATENIRRV